MKDKVKKLFITGLVAIMPIGVTLFVLYTILSFVDGLLGNTIYKAIGFRIPGLGILLVASLVLLMGIFVNSYLGRKAKQGLEKKLISMPLVGNIFSPIKDLVGNITENNAENFKSAVIVKFPNEYSYSIGFITKDNIDILGQDRLAIFVPTTPNPTNGFLMYLKAEEVIKIDMPIEQALQTIISIGTISPELIKETEVSNEV